MVQNTLISIKLFKFSAENQEKLTQQLASLKSALKIDKSKKIFFLNMNPPSFSSYVLLIDDLRGDGPVYYFFNIDQYHRVSKDFKILSNGKYNVENVHKKNTTFELIEDDKKFSWKTGLCAPRSPKTSK